MEKLIEKFGSDMVVTVEGTRYIVPRHYIALHGLKGWEIAGLGFPVLTNVEEYLRETAFCRYCGERQPDTLTVESENDGGRIVDYRCGRCGRIGRAIHNGESWTG